MILRFYVMYYNSWQQDVLIPLDQTLVWGIQMRATEPYFQMAMLSMLQKVVLTFDSVGGSFK